MSVQETALNRLVYVVDDEKLIADVVQHIFEVAGYKVEVFSDPAAALQQFSDAVRKPDVLLTDYVMRPLNGMELIQKCRAIDPDLLTILFSGNVTEKITDLYTEKPNAFVPKPFRSSALLEVVQRLLDNPSSAAVVE